MLSIITSLERPPQVIFYKLPFPMIKLIKSHNYLVIKTIVVVHSLVKLDCLPSRAVIWLYLGLTPVCHSRSYCLREVSCDRVWRGLCSGA